MSNVDEAGLEILSKYSDRINKYVTAVSQISPNSAADSLSAFQIVFAMTDEAFDEILSPDTPVGPELILLYHEMETALNGVGIRTRA